MLSIAEKWINEFSEMNSEQHNCRTRLALTDDVMSLSPQVLVLLFTHHLSPGSVGPPRQIKTPADQRAAEGHRAEQPVRAQQHRQQLQPEGQSHMRLGTGVPLGSRNTWDELNESWSVVE